MNKAICFDLNKTLINENSWLDLNLALGISKKEDDVLMDWSSRGIISDREGLQILLKLYQSSAKHTKDNMTNIVSKFTYLSGAKELINELQARSYEIILLSGAMDILVALVAKQLNIDHWYSNNRLVFNKENLLEDIITTGNDYDTKRLQLLEFCSKNDYLPTDIYCVGDGANDIELFRLTKKGITFKGSKIETEAWKVVNNLSEIGAILP